MKGGGGFGKEEFKTDEDGYGFWKNNQITNADERSLGPKEKENGKLASILGKKEKRKKNTTYNSVATTQASKEGRKEGRNDSVLRD
jgi:hypothetical protein